MKVVAASCSLNHARPGMIWDEQNNSLETDTSLNLNVRRVDYPGYWGGLSYQVIDGYDNIPIFDSQGSTRYGYWITGNMFFFNAYIYDAFGNLLSTPPAQPNQMQYGGRFGYYTDATGLGYVRARYYDPVNGRWVSRDPIGFDGGDWNVYGYVANMPIFALDPSGTASPFCSRPAVCCCCAGPASLGTVTRISNSQTMGHTVPFDLSVVWVKSKTSADCSLKWTEVTNIPYLVGTYPGVPYTNPPQLIGGNGPPNNTYYVPSPMWDEWLGHPTGPCPSGGPLPFTITDTPQIGLKDNKGNPRTVIRWLTITLFLADAPGCPCGVGTGGTQVTFNQYLADYGGVPNWNISKP